MSVWFKRVFLGIAVLGLLAAAPAQAQNGRGQGSGAAEATIDRAIPLRPTGVVPGQYIVVLKDGVVDPRAVANALARAHGLGLGLVYSSALKGFSASVPARALDALGRDPRVDYIEADQWVQAFAQTIPTGVERIFAPDNANITIDGNDDYRINVDVAVIDTGIDLDHPDLNVVGSTNCALGGPFGGDCKDGDGDDGNGHGTHVAGTIGAIDNGAGVVGVAPGARLWAVRVLDNRGSGWMSWIVGGIDWVTANTDIEVANMSLGCECSSGALDTAISNSVADGVVYAVAAGNSDKDAATFSPANHPDVITVSALADFDGVPGALGSPTCRTDQDDTGADFSNWGSLIEVAAPGVCILSTWKDGGTNTISGTSMASPHVAGAAALLAATPGGPGTPAAIRTTLIDTGNFGWSDDSGDGIQEPLLDVGDSTVFAPTTVEGDVGITPANDTPVVSITSPADGSTFDSGALIDFAGTASDTEDDNATLTANLFWTSNIDDALNGGFAASSFSQVLSDGSHTITAEATDLDGATGSASISITVDNGGGGTATVDSAAVAYATEGGKNQDKHLLITVTAMDVGVPLAGVVVSVVVEFVDATDSTKDESRTEEGTTGTDGSVTFSWKNAPSGGCYTTDVTADGVPLDPTFVDDGELDAGFCK